MPTPTSYGPYSVDNLTNGQVNTGQLAGEILANTTIVHAVQSIDTSGGSLSSGVLTGGTLTITFKDVLTSEEKAELDGGVTQAPNDPPSAGSVLGDHVAAKSTDVTSVEIKARVGGLETFADGLSAYASASQQTHSYYVLPESFHMQGICMSWDSMNNGDYGFVAVYHPSSEANPAAEAASGQATVDVGAYAPYYDPLNGAEAIEFWSADLSELIEVRKIASISGSVITLVGDLAETHATSEKIRARYKSFSPIRGTHGLDGGFRLAGASSELVENTAEITSAIFAGLVVVLTLVTSSTAGGRHLAVNFIFRRPKQ